jgi:hypothetical protein
MKTLYLAFSRIDSCQLSVFVMVHVMILYLLGMQKKHICLTPVFHQLCRYYTHNNDYLEICRCYKSIYDIPSVKENPEQWTPVKLLYISSLPLYHTTFSDIVLHVGPEENLLVLSSGTT